MNCEMYNVIYTPLKFIHDIQKTHEQIVVNPQFAHNLYQIQTLYNLSVPLWNTYKINHFQDDQISSL